MQHTTKYKFNLIETSDTFSPEALNANAEAVEKELARVEAAHAADKTAPEKTHAADKTALEKTAANKSTLEAADAALKTAIGSGGKTCRIAYGSYKGTGKTVEVDFKPLVLFYVFGLNVSVVFRGATWSVYLIRQLTDVTWGDRKVSWTCSGSEQTSSTTNYYVILGVDE